MEPYFNQQLPYSTCPPSFRSRSARNNTIRHGYQHSSFIPYYTYLHLMEQNREEEQMKIEEASTTETTFPSTPSPPTTTNSPPEDSMMRDHRMRLDYLLNVRPEGTNQQEPERRRRQTFPELNSPTSLPSEGHRRRHISSPLPMSYMEISSPSPPTEFEAIPLQPMMPPSPTTYTTTTTTNTPASPPHQDYGEFPQPTLTVVLPFRQRRHRVSAEKKVVLEESFEQNSHPSRAEKERLAKELNMTFQQVQSW